MKLQTLCKEATLNTSPPIRSTFATLTLILLSGCATLTGVNHADLGQLELPSDSARPTVRGKKYASPTAERVAPAEPSSVVRGQSPSDYQSNSSYDYDRAPTSYGEGLDDDYGRQPMPVSGAGNRDRYDSNVAPAQYGGPPQYGGPTQYGGPPAQYGGPNGQPGYGTPPPSYNNPNYGAPGYGPPADIPGTIGYANPSGIPGPEFDPGPSDMLGPQPYTGRLADLIVNVREQQTGRFMFGVGVNSDAGLTAQVVLDEYNFDWRRFPRSIDDVVNGTAWRGGGQRLRIEAIPGSELQRYLVNFTEPYLFDTNISLNLSGFLYDRRYFDWDEQRLGGRIGLGYRLTPDLSLTTGMRLENVNINDPRVRGVPELEEVLGDNSLFSGRIALTHDTRDSTFAATEGHMLEISYEQVFGSFDYPRGTIDYRRYFLLYERPDRSGRHTLGVSMRGSISGSQTPVYENYFAGGYSTLRGFRFRGAAPKSGDVFVGGELSLLGSAEYMFPITADDMLKGVVFCDYGTIEEEIKIEGDDFRVAVGAGLRVSIPAMGPAPIALDLAVPIAREQTDRIQNFSFFVGFGR